MLRELCESMREDYDICDDYDDDDIVDQHLHEYCTELCYDKRMEADGFCHGDNCIDWECYEECVKRYPHM